MAVTPDLAPGARLRVLILLALTSGVGALTYWAFGRIEVLVMAGMVSAVLVYLLAGVSLTLRAERDRVEPIIDDLVGSIDPAYWLVTDDGGTVLRLSPMGAEGLAHDPAILTGQRLADLVPLGDSASRVRLAELLRFATSASERVVELPILAEDGTVIWQRLETVPFDSPPARRQGLIVLKGRRLLSSRSP